MSAGGGPSAVLARHGIAPDADEVALLAELAARGWAARVEERETGRAGRVGAAPRYRALGIRTRPPAGASGRDWPTHRQASGRTAEAALVRVLAAVLEHEG